MMAKNVVPTAIDLGREFPKVNLGRKRWEDIWRIFRLGITSPKVEIDDLGIVKGRPVSEDTGKSISAFDECRGFIHSASIGLTMIRRKFVKHHELFFV
jgi:hypothetical protein